MRHLFLLLLVPTTACRDQRPPAPTQEQSRQLNEADEMLNELANEEGPADRSTGPSNSSD